MYDPQIGRFTGVDPISDQFAWVTTYNYAENSPIANIDLHGLQAFPIHGTKSNPDTWTINPETLTTLRGLSGNETINHKFSWVGELNGFNNDKSDRQQAAENFTNYVIGNLKEGEDITLIGHSHGGNVAIQAVNMIREKLDEGGDDRKINLITIATPAYNGEKDPENPANARIDGHIHIYSQYDQVQTSGANLVGSKDATRTYNRPETQNAQVKDYKKREGRHRSRTPHVQTYSGVNSHYIHSNDMQLIRNLVKDGKITPFK